jgi:hypothetical protein
MQLESDGTEQNECPFINDGITSTEVKRQSQYITVTDSECPGLSCPFFVMVFVVPRVASSA